MQLLDQNTGEKVAFTEEKFVKSDFVSSNPEKLPGSQALFSFNVTMYLTILGAKLIKIKLAVFKTKLLTIEFRAPSSQIYKPVNKLAKSLEIAKSDRTKLKQLESQYGCNSLPKYGTMRFKLLITRPLTYKHILKFLKGGLFDVDAASFLNLSVSMIL